MCACEWEFRFWMLLWIRVSNDMWESRHVICRMCVFIYSQPAPRWLDRGTLSGIVSVEPLVKTMSSLLEGCNTILIFRVFRGKKDNFQNIILQIFLVLLKKFSDMIFRLGQKIDYFYFQRYIKSLIWIPKKRYCPSLSL